MCSWIFFQFLPYFSKSDSNWWDSAALHLPVLSLLAIVFVLMCSSSLISLSWPTIMFIYFLRLQPIILDTSLTSQSYIWVRTQSDQFQYDAISLKLQEASQLLSIYKFTQTHSHSTMKKAKSSKSNKMVSQVEQDKIEAQPFVGYVKNEDYYFDSYSHFSIHEQMLKDTIRTKAYMSAIIDNPQLFKDKIVLDVGCGTGILSIFAARSGAKHVYGIEKANIYIHARNIIEQNKLTDQITIINGLVEEIQLPVEKVDIIISEWMGYFLLYQSMFDSVLFARDKWLAEDGILMPDRAKMFIAAIDDTAYYTKKLTFWDNVYGVSMKCMKKWVLSQPIIDPIDKNDLMSDAFLFYDINLKTVKKAELDFKSHFKINIEFEGTVHGFVSWFDCVFSHGTKKITLSTSPYKKQTHWKQTVFYLDKPIQCQPSDTLQGDINVIKAESNVRQLNVSIDFKFNTEGQQIKQFYRIS